MDIKITAQVASLLGATIGASAAVTAQLFSHFLTKRREQEKYTREVYQNLFAPIIFDVFAYFDVSTDFRKHHNLKSSITENDISEKILDHVKNNLRYASPSLISKYHFIARNTYFEDNSGFYHFLNVLEFYISILDEVDKLTTKLNLFDKNFQNMIIRYKILYLTWSASLQHFQNSTKAYAFISLNFHFNSKKYTKNTLDKINNIYNGQIFKNKWIQCATKIFRKTSSVPNPNDSNNLISIINIITDDKDSLEELSNIVFRD